MKRRFDLVDVFESGPVTGNPLGVVHDAEGLSTDEMQAIARWLNLSETTFLIPTTGTGADYHVRIFTLQTELPFAGHPTIGSCHAWLEAGGRPSSSETVVQECGVGLVELELGEHIAFAAPPLIRDGEVEPELVTATAEILGVTSAEIEAIKWCDNGPGWIGVILRDAEVVLSLSPDPSRSAIGLPFGVGVVGPHHDEAGPDFEVRAFFPNDQGQFLEDPVTGSLNASIGQWLFDSGRAEGGYLAAQGTAIGRAGRVHVTQDETGQVWVGGTANTVVTGEIDF